MHASKNDLPLLLKVGGASVRGADWGDLRVLLLSVPAGTDFTPLFEGLPEGLCQSPHWGYVLRGRLRVQYPDRTEVLRAGDFYYLPAPHTGYAEEDVEFMEVVRPHEHEPVFEAMKRNVQRMQT